MKPLYISYHTPDVLYTACAMKLRDTLNWYNQEYIITCLPALGDWYANIYRKTVFIQEMSEAHPDRDIVWLDADSVMSGYPIKLEEVQADVACVLWDGKRVMTSTVYFAANDRVKSFIRRWVELTGKEMYQFSPDQYSLSMTLREMPQVKFERLPDSYAYCINESPKAEPVIIVGLISRYGGHNLYPRDGTNPNAYQR